MISQDLHDSLRRRFNPDGSALRQQQLRMLDLLCAVDDICRRHGIRYWLSSGTLIGAVRHEGFIPWDDDLDIEMLWDDYRRLMDVLPRELPDSMALQTWQTDPNYFFHYAKVRDRRSLVEETTGYDLAWRYRGIFLDIFPFYRQPLWLHMLSERLHGHVYKIVRRQGCTARAMRKVRLITQVNARLLHPLMRLVCRLSRSRETYGLGIPYHDPRHMEDIFPLGEATFEGRRFPVPYDSDAVLRLKYGDYMQLPDVEQLSPHSGRVTFL